MKKKKQGVPAAVKKQSFKAYMKGHYDLYLLLLPAILYTAVFLYSHVWCTDGFSGLQPGERHYRK